MGSYIYTFKKKFNKNVSLGNEKVVVGQATFLCKQDWSGNYSSIESREMTRATCLLEHDQPDYITFDGEMVYKNNKRGLWSDGSGFWSGIDYKKDFIGTLKKVGRKFVIEK